MHWLIIVYETWESLANKLLTSEESGKSRNQNKVNPDQVTKWPHPSPREGNFHDAGFQPPHPHLLHHWHWVGCQSSLNHTSKVLAPLHTDKVLALHIIVICFFICGFDKVLLVPALQSRANTSWSRLRMLLRRVEQTTTKIGALGVMVVPLATTNGSPRALGVVVPPVGRGWPMMPVLRCQRLWWNSLWFL